MVATIHLQLPLMRCLFIAFITRGTMPSLVRSFQPLERTTFAKDDRTYNLHRTRKLQVSRLIPTTIFYLGKSCHGSFVVSTVTSCSFLHSRSNHLEEMPMIEKDVLRDNNSVFGSEMDLSKLSLGIPSGFYVVKEYHLPEWDSAIFQEEKAFLDYLLSRTNGISLDDIRRLELKPDNLTLPVALMISDPDEFPSLSRARKACRKGTVLVHRKIKSNSSESASFCESPKNCFKGRVGDRIYRCTDSIGKQVRMGSGYSPLLSYAKPPFDLPVVYEDDHFALVNKPAGIAVYATGRGRNFRMSIRGALPFVLSPPSVGTYATLRRPASVHRLDKATSGLLVIAKTKPAMVHLAGQFHDRIAKKTYMAIVNGRPVERIESKVTSQDAFALGVDIDEHERDADNIYWQMIDSPLEEKNATTFWRALEHVQSLHANDGYLTLVEIKLKTGRYHQIRRHMAWNCCRPIVGDDIYDGGTSDELTFRGRGLFLCSNRITLEHPFYNSVAGSAVWEKLSEDRKFFDGGRLWLSDTGKAMITAEITLPEKFRNLLLKSEKRHKKMTDCI